MKYFGTNGIRGTVNETLDSAFSLRTGRAIAGVLGPGPIAIACDPRPSSDMIRCAVVSGLLSMGVDVLDLGMIPTPALQLYVKRHGNVTGGVMITASHNPPQFNGIKCISADGTECSKDEESRIEALIDNPPALPSWKEVGTLRSVSGAADDYVDAIVASVDADAIRDAHLIVCLDCSNGAACVTSPKLMKRLGVRAITLNSDPQGEFPGHPSEPTRENLVDLARMVAETGADLGIAHDGDADRCVFVDDRGVYLDGNIALGLFARGILTRNGGGTVVFPVATSRIVDDVARACGGRLVRTAVGSPVVARAMMAEGGLFGGEENGGLIFADHQYCRDGGMAAARMLEMIARKGCVSEMVSTLPKYVMIKRAVPCPEGLKGRILEHVPIPEGVAVDRTDGLRIDAEDWWAIMRPSGTEPKFRIYAESESGETAERVSDFLMREFEEAVRQLEGSQ